MSDFAAGKESNRAVQQVENDNTIWLTCTVSEASTVEAFFKADLRLRGVFVISPKARLVLSPLRVLLAKGVIVSRAFSSKTGAGRAANLLRPRLPFTDMKWLTDFGVQVESGVVNLVKDLIGW